MLRYLIPLFILLGTVSAQESPYFVTYDHHLEEPGNLEIETFSTMGIPRSGQSFYAAPYMPFCAYCVHISTTFLLSETDAFSTPSRRMFALMNSTARYAPVLTACVEAPVNQ